MLGLTYVSLSLSVLTSNFIELDYKEISYLVYFFQSISKSQNKIDFMFDEIVKPKFSEFFFHPCDLAKKKMKVKIKKKTR